MKTIINVFQIILASLLASCSLSSVNSDRSDTLNLLIHSQECASPCWIGIEVENTDFTEAKRILENRYTVENVHAMPDFVEWQANGIDSLTHGSVTFSNGTVNSVLVFFSGKDFTVDDIVGTLGEPSNVMIDIAPYVPKSQCLGVQLFYPETGVIVFLDTSETFKGVQNSQFISGLRFMSPPLLQNLQVYDGILVDWQGYQDYCQIIYTMPTPTP